MARRVLLTVLVVLVLVAVGSYAYVHYRTDRRLNGGEVVDETGNVLADGSGAPVKTPTRSETSESRDNGGATTGQNVPVTRAAVQPVVQPAYSTAPAMDSLAPNAPNRAAFAGTGKFQVYRQGDLTWRVDTDSGRTCILFATEEQWRKPVVYRNGCPTR